MSVRGDDPADDVEDDIEDVDEESTEEKAEKPSNLLDLQEARWLTKLIRKGGKKAPPKTILANAVIPLRMSKHWRGVLHYNSFSHVIEVHKQPPWPEERDPNWKMRAWTDYDDMMLTEWLQQRAIDVPTRLASDAVFTVAKENSYHPVKDYLDKLQWDEKPRLEKMLHTYFGADDSTYHTAIGMRWMVAGIARILNPGPDCKADHVLILEGEQGLQKSTALRVLSTPWFLDDLRQFGSKDAAMKIAGRWIVEIAELTAMNETTSEACKTFFGQTMDSFRPPYGRRVIDTPRQCIFAASTNKNVFLKDDTGDRRYWPVLCTRIDVEAIKNDRDQLWAEAKALYMRGQQWWLDTPELKALAEEEQRMRFESDPWESSVRSFLRERQKITPEEILTGYFDFDLEDVTRAMRNRMSSILRHLKWSRIRLKDKDHRDDYIWVRSANTLK
jgi:predicted P-loop ATPase